MAMYEAPRPAPFGAITTFRVVNFFDTLVSGYRRWSIARRTETELSKLSNRELADIGLDRGWLNDVSEDFAGRR